MPAHAGSKPFGNGKMGMLPGKTRHGPFNAGNRGGNTGKFSKLPGRMNNNPMRTGNRQMFNSGPRHFSGGMGGGRFNSFASGPSRGSFGGGGFGGGRSFGGGGFGRR
jgi:hypothetical protein